MTQTYLDQLRGTFDKEWPNIATAEKAAWNTRSKLVREFVANGERPTSSDTDIVVFGSLARDEWTSRSDVDWTLLIDGQADPAHRTIANNLQERLTEAQRVAPGTSGTFGNLAFSHDIIHRIGGQADTNINTTQRVLLLLESARIETSPDAFPMEGGAYNRVLRSVLDRYLADDTNFLSRDGSQSMVPRFLLNDIVRFWRTMCVDFAMKGWEQGKAKWALRNIKLRMSRKLIFVSGMLMCASGYLDNDLRAANDAKSADQSIEPLRSRLIELVGMPPLQIVAHALLNYSNRETVERVMDAYDWFLRLLNDEGKRTHVEKLQPAEAYGDDLFQECRGHSHRFQEGLTRLFFEDHERLAKFTRTYGVF